MMFCPSGLFCGARDWIFNCFAQHGIATLRSLIVEQRPKISSVEVFLYGTGNQMRIILQTQAGFSYMGEGAFYTTVPLV